MTFTQQEWDALIACYPRGTPVSGVVVRIAPFGVFVRLDDLSDVPALLEIVEFKVRWSNPDHRIEFPTDYPAVGSPIEARILAWSLLPKEVRLTQFSHPEWGHNEWLAGQVSPNSQ